MLLWWASHDDLFLENGRIAERQSIKFDDPVDGKGVNDNGKCGDDVRNEIEPS